MIKNKECRLAIGLFVLAIWAFGCQGSVPAADTADHQQNESQVTGTGAPAYFYFTSAQLKLKNGEVNEAAWLLEKAIRHDPQSAYLKLELAKLKLMHNDTDQALLLIQEVLTEHPDHSEALVLTGRIYQQREETAKAISAYEKAIASRPSDQNVYLSLGRIYWNENDLANAERVFRIMVSTFPTSYGAHYFSGKVLAAQGKQDQAIAAFTKSLELEPSLEEPRFELIEIYRSLDQPEQITQTYNAILKYNPDNIKAALALAVHYNENNQDALGQKRLQELGVRSRNDNNVISTVFETYLETKQYDTAIWVLEGMLKGAPENTDLHYFAGVAHDGLNHTELALEHLVQVQSQSRFYKNAVVHSALLLHGLEETDRAIQVIQDALVKNPQHVEYYLYLGTFYEELTRYEEASEILIQGISIDDSNYRLFFRLGVVQNKMGRTEDSIQAMKRVIQLKPDYAEALNFLGYTYADMGIQLDEAEVLIQNALKIKPDDGYIKDSLAWVYYKRGQYDKALKWLKRALELVPNDPVILEHLGDVYLKLENPQEALQYYRRSLELNPGDRKALEDKIRALKTI